MEESSAAVLNNTRTRAWREEADILLSMIDCLVLDREAVYASSEFTTGWRFYELCRRYNVRSGDDLKKKLGDKYKTELLIPNTEEGIRFARSLREKGHPIVLTPHPLAAPGWSQPEYLTFWEEVIRRKCHTVYFNERWEYSNGSSFEFFVGVKAGLPLFDHQGKPLSVQKGRGLIATAVRELESDGFEVPKLKRVLEELRIP